MKDKIILRCIYCNSKIIKEFFKDWVCGGCGMSAKVDRNTVPSYDDKSVDIDKRKV